MPEAVKRTLFRNANVVLPGEVRAGSVLIENGIILDVDAGPRKATVSTPQLVKNKNVNNKPKILPIFPRSAYTLICEFKNK